MTEHRLKHPPVLVYHSIEQLAPANRGGEVFKRQMKFLAQHGYRTLTADGFVQAIEDGAWDPKSVLLTFDDGFMDFYTLAFPVLRELGLPATVFLVADVLDRGAQGWAGPHPASTPAPMGWEEVRAMRGGGIFFGSHGASHRHLNRIRPDELPNEIVRSKRSLEAGLGEEIALFAYPYGGCDESAKAAVEAAGYSAGLGLRPRTPDRFEIPRREIAASQTSLSFGMRVSLAFPVLSRLSHLARHRRQNP